MRFTDDVGVELKLSSGNALAVLGEGVSFPPEKYSKYGVEPTFTNPFSVR